MFNPRVFCARSYVAHSVGELFLTSVSCLIVAFNRVQELSLKYGDSIPHLIFIFNGADPRGFRFCCYFVVFTWCLCGVYVVIL